MARLNTDPLTDWPTIDAPWPEIDMQTKPCKTGGRMSPSRLSATAKKLKCFEMRLNGSTFREIGEAVKLNTATVWKHVRDVADEVKQSAKEDAAELLQLELLRLDKIQSANWKGCMLGLALPTQHVFRAMEQRARLLGLYAPAKLETKSEVKPPDGHYAVDALGLSVETRKAILEGMERVKAKSVSLDGMKPIE